jgi:hypothetical protein
MSVTYVTSLKNTRMTDVVTAIGATGYINLYTAGGATLLSSIPLPSPAGTVANGVLTFSGVPLTEASANASGTAASATVSTAINGGGTVVISGLTVVASGSAGDIVLSSTNIVAGQPVTLTSASIQHA